VTYRPIRACDLDTAPGSAIGRPIPDLQLYCLDRHGELVPFGVPGELYVGGRRSTFVLRPVSTAPATWRASCPMAT
jgi:non-ribosomal peptide synthetase component F